MRQRDKHGKETLSYPLPYLFPLTEISFSRGQIPFDTVCPISSTISVDAVNLMAAWIARRGEWEAAMLLAHRGNLYGLLRVEPQATFSPRWEDCSHVLLNATRHQPLSSLTTKAQTHDPRFLPIGWFSLTPCILSQHLPKSSVVYLQSKIIDIILQCVYFSHRLGHCWTEFVIFSLWLTCQIIGLRRHKTWPSIH